ncbi:hypothetical protein ES707_09028 [subsurface metagenome]
MGLDGHLLDVVAGTALKGSSAQVHTGIKIGGYEIAISLYSLGLVFQASE